MMWCVYVREKERGVFSPRSARLKLKSISLGRIIVNPSSSFRRARGEGRRHIVGGIQLNGRRETRIDEKSYREGESARLAERSILYPFTYARTSSTSWHHALSASYFERKRMPAD